MAKKKSKKATCPSCNRQDFNVHYDTEDKRPRFQCVDCGETWTSGKDGGKYMTAYFQNKRRNT